MYARLLSSFVVPSAVLALALSAAECRAQVSCLLDPVITHTNGVRLASSTPERSHNMYWQCDPNHIGYCGGRMYGPCRNDLRSLGTRPMGCLPLPPGPAPGPVRSHTMHAMDGIEQEDGATLGAIPFIVVPGAAAGVGLPGS